MMITIKLSEINKILLFNNPNKWMSILTKNRTSAIFL